MKVFLLVFFAALLSWQCEAYQMTRCQLVKELRKNKFSENLLRDWVCLVEAESDRRTEAIGPPNSDGSHDHGLFQINDRYWCSKTNTPEKDCHVTCKDCRTNDITKASACAQLIYKRQKFDAWYGWRSHCRGKPLPDISKCK